MKREWKPGDVAMVCTTSHDAIRCVRRSGVWMYLDQEGYAIDAYVNDVRPLVVIDPEDTREVEALASLIGQWTDRVPYDDMRKPGDLTQLTAMQAALREFVAPPTCTAELALGKDAALYRCGEDEGHAGPHHDGTCTWTAKP